MKLPKEMFDEEGVGGGEGAGEDERSGEGGGGFEDSETNETSAAAGKMRSLFSW